MLAHALSASSSAFVLIAWAGYNQHRFSGRQRRQHTPPLPLRRLQDSFDLPPDMLERAHAAHVMVIAHEVKQGEVPEDCNQAKRSQKDVDARWTVKHGKSYYGYKLHVNVDRCCGLIRQYEVSPANEHDSRHFETLLDGNRTHCINNALTHFVGNFWGVIPHGLG